MKKIFIRSLYVTVLLFIIMGMALGCGNQKSTGEAEKLPGTLTMGTMPMGSSNNAVGLGIASVISDNSQMEVRVVAMSGPTEYAPMMNSQEIDLGIAATYEAQMGYLGKDVFEEISNGEGFPFRLVTSGSMNRFGTVVAADSGIKTGADLAGKRFVGEITGSANASALQRSILANQNLTRDDVKWVSVPGVVGAVRAIIEGRADAAPALYGMAAVQELEASKGARFLPLDPSPEAMARLQKEYPAFATLVEPNKDIPGVKEPTYLAGYNNYLIAREDLSDEAVYEIVKALWENNADLTKIHVGLRGWVPDKFISVNASLPYHPGAIKYFKEKGVWNSEMDNIQQKLLSQK